jgi:hypothetical protein
VAGVLCLSGTLDELIFALDSCDGIGKAFVLRLCFCLGDLKCFHAKLIFRVQTCEAPFGSLGIGFYSISGFLRVNMN